MQLDSTPYMRLYAGKRAIAKELEYEEDKILWTMLFDPGQQKQTRTAALETLRKRVKTPEELSETQYWEINYRCRMRPGVDLCVYLSEQRDLKDMTVAIVMVQGFRYRDTFAFLKQNSIAERYVLIGYTSDTYRCFIDGTSMARVVFTPREDLDTLKNHSGAPLLLVDDVNSTHTTFATIGTSLREQIGYKGEMYQLTHSEIGEWDGKVHGGMHGLPTNVQIITEKEEEIGDTLAKIKAERERRYALVAAYFDAKDHA